LSRLDQTGELAQCAQWRILSDCQKGNSMPFLQWIVELGLVSFDYLYYYSILFLIIHLSLSIHPTRIDRSVSGLIPLKISAVRAYSSSRVLHE
jgi:hypothetical protein